MFLAIIPFQSPIDISLPTVLATLLMLFVISMAASITVKTCQNWKKFRIHRRKLAVALFSLNAGIVTLIVSIIRIPGTIDSWFIVGVTLTLFGMILGEWATWKNIELLFRELQNRNEQAIGGNWW